MKIITIMLFAITLTNEAFAREPRDENIFQLKQEIIKAEDETVLKQEKNNEKSLLENKKHDAKACC